MRYKKIVSIILSAAVTASLSVGFSVNAQETVVNDAAVSGYVSMSANADSLTLVSNDKAPTIYVDNADYEGVVRAVGDLQGDIEAVTGVKPTVTNEIETEPLTGCGVTIGDSGTSNYFNYPVPADAQCYIAAYNRDGTLAGVVLADEKIGAENFSDGKALGFRTDKVLKRPAGGTVKGFLWQDMKPAADVKGLYATEAVQLSSVDVVVGTIGESKVIDNLALEGKLNTSEIECLRESFTIQNIDSTLVIAGSDKRGTIYGIYDLSEKIGVSPWSFWADTQIGHADNLYINLPTGGYTEGEPDVEYRGIFLNDEFNMSEWSKSMGKTGKNMNNETYEKIFELLLRLKANYLWPAMHTYSTAFNVTEHNAELADMYGIVMGSSHCEPLLRNNLGELYAYQQEWSAAHPDKKLYINTTDDAKNKVSWMWTDKDSSGNAVDNKEFLTDYWRARASINGAFENTYTLGMRGVHDGRFNTNMNTKTAMSEIIAAQTKILEDEVVKDGQTVADVPQVFIPYKEILDLYNGGLEVPDYVTLLWPDDNFGYIRQLPTEAERARSGGAGVYYHLSYFGRPQSYLWLGTTQLGLIREEMTKAYDMGAQKVWVANVGDLKPAETEIEYFLDLAKDVDGVRNEDIADWLADNAKRDFGFDDTKAAEYADIKLDYYELANSRRPEHMTEGLYSLADFGDEGQKTLDRYASLEARAAALSESLEEAKRPSFYELMLYPIKGAHAMAEKYVYADKAKQYADNNWGSAANKYASLSDMAQDKIVSDTAAYTSMLDSKWDKMMNPFQTQLKGSFGGPISGKLTNPTVSELGYTNMKIVPEGGENRLNFSNYTIYPKFIDIINTGSGSFRWKAQTNSQWITLNKTSGTVADNDRIYVSVDASKIQGVFDGAEIKFTRYIGETAVDTQSVSVTYANVAVGDLAEKTYAESNGYVSVEAEHYTESVKNGDYEWRVEKDFGRSGDSVKIYPNTAANVKTPNKDNSAYLEYQVYFTTSGTFPIDIYRMPTINELAGATQRFRIGIDDETPVQFNGNTKTTDNSTGTDAWGKGVMCNSNVVSGKITVPSSGLHKIRLYNESAGVVIDKFVITTDVEKASYYGAPESYNTTYNNTMKPLPEPSAAAAEQTGDITALFEPQAIITGVSSTETGEKISLVKVGENDSRMNLYIIASYDKDGNMQNMLSGSFSLENVAINDTAVISAPQIPVTDDTAQIQYMLLGPSETHETRNRKPIAEAVTLNVNSGAVEPMASYENGYAYPAANMKPYAGREAVCFISEENDLGEVIRYARQETVDENTFKEIPFNRQGKYKVHINVAGVDDMIEENLSTIINIQPDTETSEKTIYTQTFDTDPSDGKVTITSPAAYDSVNKCVKMTSAAEAGGAVTVDFDEAVKAAQGDKLIIKSDIAYGNLSGKFMNYEILDSNKNAIVSSKINRYTGKTQSLTIGGVEKLIDNNYPAPIQKLNDSEAPVKKFTTYTTTIDISSGNVTVVVSSSAGSVTYEGSLSDGTSYDVKKLNFTTDYNNVGRTCYVDNISIAKEKAASYTMKFIPTVSGAQTEADTITVTDALTGAVIDAESDGTYKLCDGMYDYTITAGGKTVTNSLELSPATESKTILVNMDTGETDIPDTPSGKANITIAFVDEEGNTVKDSVNVEGDFKVGDAYSVPESYRKDIAVASDGVTLAYKYNAGRSVVSISSLEENNVFTLVFNMTDSYVFYEDYENYDMSANTWVAGSKQNVKPTVAEENGSKYLSYISNGNTHAACTKLNKAIDCTGQEVTLDVDFRFSPAGTAGNSQFTIGSDSPTFSNNEVDWGILTSSTGHIVAFEYNEGKTFKVNGQSISTDFIGDWMHMTAVMDFNTHKVSIKLTNDSGTKAELNDIDFFNSDKSDNIGSYYVRAAKTNGTVSIDNLTMTSRPSSSTPVVPDTPIYQKSVYAFGDSIVYGHKTPNESFMSLIKADYGIKLNMMAKNGATVIDSINDIIAQVNGAPSDAPDIVVFDGYTNDAYGDPSTDSFNTGGADDVTTKLGTIQGKEATSFDNSTFCGAFEEILYTMKTKWPDTKIVFITIHKSGGRDFTIQQMLVEKTLEMCQAWDVEVVDMFNDSILDTMNADEMSKYIIGGKGSHPNVAACREFYIPAVAAKLESFYGN